MGHVRTWMLRGCAVFGILLAGCAHGDPAPAKLTAPADHAVQKAFPGATVGPAQRSREDGVWVYEAGVAHALRKMEIEVTADGQIIEIEEDLTPAHLPQPVAAAIAARAAGAEILSVEREEEWADIDDGKVVARPIPEVTWEVKLLKGCYVGDMEIAPDGAVKKARWKEGKQIEEEIGLADVPEAARAAILAAAGDHELTMVEKASVEGRVVYYEAKWWEFIFQKEVEVTPDGQPFDDARPDFEDVEEADEADWW